MGKGTRILQRCINYLQILGARRMAFSNFHTDGPKLWKPVYLDYFALSARSALNDAQRGENAVIMQNIVGIIIRKSFARADQAPEICSPLAMISLKTKTFPHQPRNDQLVKRLWPMELKERDFKV